MSDNKIKCPHCGKPIDVDEVLSHQAEVKFQQAYETKNLELQQREKAFEENRTKAQEEYKLKLDADRQRIAKEEAEKAAQKAKEEVDVQLKLQAEELEKRKQENTELKKKEFDFLKREEGLKEKEQELELQLQRRLQEERSQIEEKLAKQEQEKSEMRFKDYEKQLTDQKKLIEDLQRKATQGSMQLQGEVQELALEALLKEAFPFDLIEEVGKGIRGADCIQIVRNQFGHEAGKIIFESKRTKNFENDWIEKLKADMRAQNADTAVLVTQVMPKDMEQFGERNGIWICSYSEVRGLVHVLRNSILKVFAVMKSQENKGDKVQLLYEYLTSSEFSEQWKAIREGFLSMKHSIDTERNAMEKLWKAREKQLEKILLSASHVSGSVEGIAGTTVDLKLLGEGND